MRRRTSAFTYVAERGLGLSNDFQDAIYREEASSLQASTRNYIYDGGMRVWSMELDPVDERYLLVGTSKSVINLYDLKMLDDNDACDPRGTSQRISHYDTGNRLPPVSSVVAQRIHRDNYTPSVPSSSSSSSSSSRAKSSQPVNQQALQFGITSLDWYPVDGGMFISSSFDGLVKVWDSMMFTVELDFAFNCKVYCAKFSSISTTHTLIAAALANREVRLCDMRTDSSLHSLLGHQDEVWSLAWSRTNEFQLTTGSRSGEMRMWDIRRSGATACLFCMNQDGKADVPGRSSLYTNVKRLPSTSLETAARTTHKLKRRRVEAPTSGSSSTGDGKKGKQPKERSDPNLAASVSLARAHSAAVNSLAYTPDGRFLLSSSHDNRLRVWDAATGDHLFVNYEGVHSTQTMRNVQMAVIQEGDAQQGTMVFHPNGKDGELTSYRVHAGEDHAGAQPITRITAHYKPIVSCVYRRSRRELFTGASDGLIMKWKPTPIRLDTADDEEHDGANPEVQAATGNDQDAWSDDDDGDADGGRRATGNEFVPPILRQDFSY